MLGQCGGAEGVIGNGVAIDILSGNNGLLHTVRQLGTHLRYSVAYVGDRAIDGRADIEFNENQTLTLDREGGDVVDVANAGNRSLDLLNDLGFDFRGCGARLCDRHLHHRIGDVRVERNGQANERHDAHE